MSDFYYVTRYGLTDGIWKVSKDKAEPENGYLYIKDGNKLSIQILAKDWFTDLESAQNRVAAMVTAKLKSLDKTRAKLAGYRPKIKVVPHE